MNQIQLKNSTLSVFGFFTIADCQRPVNDLFRLQERLQLAWWIWRARGWGTIRVDQHMAQFKRWHKPWIHGVS